MSNSRRYFLSRASAALAALSAACRKPPAESSAATPGAPPAFGTSPDFGPPVSPGTFSEAEKLVQFRLRPASARWPPAIGARAWPLFTSAVPGRASSRLRPTWRPPRAGTRCFPACPPPPRDRFVRTPKAADPLPANDQDIAFAPVTQLSRWIETRQLTSERLTRIYLDRLERFDPKLRCVITLTARSGAGAGQAGGRGNRRRKAIAARCTASPGAPRTCSIPPASRLLMAPSRSAIACPARTPPW